MHKHSIALMHASHSCIIVAESSENEPVEPAESVEPEPNAECVVEPEEHQGKQLSIISCTHLIWFSLVISLGYYWVIYILYYVLYSCTYFDALSFRDLFIHVLVTC